jgi:hypothetical protein
MISQSEEDRKTDQMIRKNNDPILFSTMSLRDKSIVFFWLAVAIALLWVMLSAAGRLVRAFIL